MQTLSDKIEKQRFLQQLHKEIQELNAKLAENPNNPDLQAQLEYLREEARMAREM